MKQVLWTLLLCIFATAAFAQETPTETTEVKTQVPNVVQNREGKKFSMSAGLVGPFLPNSSGYTLSGGYFLNRDTVVELNFSNLRKSSRVIPEVEQASYVLQLKRFVWGGVYLGAGLNQTNVSYKSDFIFRNETALSFEGSKTAVNLVLGVEHQFKSFKWGVETLGYTQPFAHSISKEYLALSNDADLREDLRSAQVEYLEKGDLVMARFYIGASF